VETPPETVAVETGSNAGNRSGNQQSGNHGDEGFPCVPACVPSICAPARERATLLLQRLLRGHVPEAALGMESDSIDSPLTSALTLVALTGKRAVPVVTAVVTMLHGKAMGLKPCQ